MRKMKNDELNNVTGGSGNTYLYKYVVYINGVKTLEKDGYNSELEAKNAGNEAANDYIATNNLINAIKMVVATKYLGGESEDYKIHMNV